MTLAELAEHAGIPARTIRFYIARGLLQGPVKAGRDAEYSRDHLQRLEEIKKLQAEGRTLTAIGQLLIGPAPAIAAPQPAAWWQYVVTDEVMVWVKAGQSPWVARQMQAMLADLARALRKLERQSRKGQEPE
jgi:DNA-binding transcriptional MerR regulator